MEKQLSVTSDPPVSGSWHWFGSERVDFRPEQYWAPGTKVTLRMRLDGVKAGSSYGRQDRDVTFTIGRSLVATMDAAAHKMTVVEDGKSTTLLTSSGKTGFETWNGTMVVLEKMQDIEMNSSTVGIFGVNAYDIPDVYWDVRLTPSGHLRARGALERREVREGERLARLHRPVDLGRGVVLQPGDAR